MLVMLALIGLLVAYAATWLPAKMRGRRAAPRLAPAATPS
jgi:hypothetical protein